MNIGVSSANRPRRLVSACLAFVQAFRPKSAAISGPAPITAPMETPVALLPSAQDQSLSRIAALYRQRQNLLVEKEIVAAERARAVRQRKKVSHFNARLKAINAELLSIGE